MAIIYSYPENNNILPTDILVCTSTALINGKPKNQTKNISIADLTAFMALNGNNLNDVLTNGNTSLLNANIGQLGLFDAQAQNYGSLELSSSEFNFYNTSNVLTSALTSDSLILYPNSYSGQLLVPNTITTDRVYTFQDASGTVAYLSDITAATNLDAVLTNGNVSQIDAKVGGIFLYNPNTPSGNGYVYITGDKNRFNFYNNVGSYYANIAQDALVLIDSVVPTRQFQIAKPAAISANRIATFQDANGTIAYLSDIPVLTGFVPYTGATQAVNLGAFNLLVNGVSVGKGAGSGIANVAIGQSALGSATTGNQNVVVGTNALANSTTAGNNTAIGNQSMGSNTTGSNNVAVGDLTLNTPIAANQSVVIGAQAMQNATASLDNIAIGYAALKNSATANSVAIGSQAMLLTTTGSNSTAIGHFSMNSNTTSIWNVAIGMDSLRNNTIGNYNTAIGSKALGSGNTTASGNTGVGFEALFINTSSNNTAVGFQAMRQNSGGAENTAIGYRASIGNTFGSSNTAVGYNSLSTTTNSSTNTAVGAQTLRDNSTGSGNTSVGALALPLNTTGSLNTAVGSYCMSVNTTGNSNTAIGYNSLNGNTTGSSNVALGLQASLANTTGTANTVIGLQALLNNVTGSNNIALGKEAARYSSAATLITSTESVFLGFNTRSLNTSSTNEIVIGANAIGAGDNTVTLGNTSITTTRLRGAVQGGSFVKDGGTSSEYLLADGSVTTSGPSGYKYNFSGSLTLTGTLTTTNLLTITIPANSLSDYLDLRSLMVQQSGPVLAGFQIRVWHNSVNDFNTATRIANFAFGGGGADLYAQMTRKFSIQSGTLFGFSSTPSSATGDGSNPNAALSIAFNPAAINYLFVSIQLNNVTDTATLRNVNITN